jgi:prepilin-type N-terminal cleavage/methylation domain-containing protein
MPFRVSGFARAFTLVELLVVFAIVSIMAALLLPGLASTRRKSRITQCSSQLHQLGLAMAVYGADNNDLLPAAHSVVPWGSTNPVAWTKLLFPQPSEPQLLTCPSYSRVYYQSHFNYFMGSRCVFIEAGAQAASLPLRRIRFPSQYVLSGDCNFPFLAQDADPDNYTVDTLFALVPVGHGGQVNVLFDDLHVLRANRFDPESMTFSLTERGKPWDE